MYLQNVISVSRKRFWIRIARSTDPRIRINTKMSRTAILGPIYYGSGRIQILPGYFCGHFFESLINSEVPDPYLRIVDPGPDPGGNRIRISNTGGNTFFCETLPVTCSSLQPTCNKGLVSGAACKWDSVFVCFCNQTEKTYKIAFDRKGFEGPTISNKQQNNKGECSTR
jgi:hypothetical protein